MLLSSIIGNLGKFIRLKISGPAVEQDDGLNLAAVSWEPTVEGGPVVIDTPDFNASITATATGAEITDLVSELGGLQAFCSAGVDFFKPTRSAFYFSIDPLSASSGDQINLVAYDVPGGNATAGIVLLTLERNAGEWRITDPRRGGTLGTLDDAALFSSIICVSVNQLTGSTSAGLRYYFQDSAGPGPNYALIVDLSGITLPPLLYPGLIYSSGGIGGLPAGLKLTQYTAPPFQYPNEPPVTGPPAVVPSSYPANRAGRSFTVRGAATFPATVASAFGPLWDGRRVGFDLNGDPSPLPQSDAPPAEGVTAEGDNEFTGFNEFTGGLRLEVGLKAKDNDGDTLEANKSYQYWITNDGPADGELYLPVSPDRQPSKAFPQVSLKVGGRPGSVRLYTDDSFANFWKNGADTGLTEYIIQSGEEAHFIYGGQQDSENGWSIISAPPQSATFYIDFQTGAVLNPNQTAGVSTISPIFRASLDLAFVTPPFLNPVCNLDKCFIYSVRPQFLSNGVWVFGESATVRNAAGVLDAAYGLRSTVEGDFIKTRCGAGGVTLPDTWNTAQQTIGSAITSAPCRIEIKALENLRDFPAV